ncbi:LemA family protein [Lactobacillus sp. YT155]|uniref:LemA family protein n=1 Tax=Lactobacillus sp. YT155 TaxID=3060955 RepID=UPI00265EBEC2|nr:LemA family protein [Lactobacillus sp. YT155]MDO1604633.1 LemA family protein [Lactobacillus sp. YT155]
MNKTKRNIWIAVGVVVAVIVIYSISSYNSLAKSNQDVKSQASQVENVMNRRYDLIPNLVNSVKGSMKQEKDVFGDIAKARQNYSNASSTAKKADASAQLDQSVGTLINVIREDYPELNSNKNVSTLMTQLEGSENRIATERKRYNEKVSDFNKSVVTFPKNIFANMYGFHQKEYFKASDKAKENPKVDFNN